MGAAQPPSTSARTAVLLTGAPVDDASLVEAAQIGDVQQFALLFERHVGLVRAVVRDNVRTPEDHADCVQEVFARALESLDRLQDPSRFRSWLLGITRHVAIDGRRRRLRDAERLSEHPTEDLPGHRRPSIEVELRELGSTVRGALAALPPREATAVALATYLELKPDEIGAALGVSSGNAKVIVHRARRHLRTALIVQMLQRGEGCDDFRSLDQADAATLGDHVLECERCARDARALLHVDRA